jgi:oligopeptide transport system substrate-binding protein
MWQTALNVRIDLDVQEWKTYLQNRQHHNYQLARAGWIGDYLDPITFLDMFHSNSGNNDFQYENKEFDALINSAKETSDTVARVRMLHLAEKKLIADDMAVAPIYFYVKQYLQKPEIKGITRNALGYIYFDKAEVAR